VTELSWGWGTALASAHLCLCVVVALYARRERSHIPFLVFLVSFFIADRLRSLTGVHLDRAHAPYVGFDRVLLHTDRFLYLASRFGFAWVCGHIFQSRVTKWLAASGFAVTYLFLLVTYPPVDATLQGYVFQGAEVFWLMIAWFSALRAALGGAHVKPNFLHLVLLVLLGSDSVAVLVGYLDNAVVGIAGSDPVWAAIMATTFVAYVVCISVYASRLFAPEPRTAEVLQ
jgi:hypothetical protein